MRTFTKLLTSLTVLGAIVSPALAASAGSDCCDAPKCCYNPCIKYIEGGKYRPCGPTVPTVLQVKDPCTCCIVDVPVCLPACLTGEPCIDAKCGALGNGKVFYSWCNGVELKIIFTKCGDITVVYLRA